MTWQSWLRDTVPDCRLPVRMRQSKRQLSWQPALTQSAHWPEASSSCSDCTTLRKHCRSNITTARSSQVCTLVCCSTAKASWRAATLCAAWALDLIQQMSSQRRKPHFFRQCLPASRPSALPHLHQKTFAAHATLDLTSHHLLPCPGHNANARPFSGIPKHTTLNSQAIFCLSRWQGVYLATHTDGTPLLPESWLGKAAGGLTTGRGSRACR